MRPRATPRKMISAWQTSPKFAASFIAPKKWTALNVHRDRACSSDRMFIRFHQHASEE
jgi:hypothetical protein